MRGDASLKLLVQKSQMTRRDSCRCTCVDEAGRPPTLHGAGAVTHLQHWEGTAGEGLAPRSVDEDEVVAASREEEPAECLAGVVVMKRELRGWLGAWG